MKKHRLLSSIILLLCAALCGALFVACGDGAGGSGGSGNGGDDTPPKPEIPSVFEPLVEVASVGDVKLSYTAGESVKTNDSNNIIINDLPIELNLYASRTDTVPYMTKTVNVRLYITAPDPYDPNGIALGDLPGYFQCSHTLYADDDLNSVFEYVVNSKDAGRIYSDYGMSDIIYDYIEEYDKKNSNFDGIGVSPNMYEYSEMVYLNPSAYIKDVAGAKQKLIDAVNIEIKSNKDNPKKAKLFEVSKYGDAYQNVRITPYSYLEYSNMGFTPNSYSSMEIMKKVDKSFFEPLGSLAGDNGLYVKFDRKFNVQYKGVYYEVEYDKDYNSETIVLDAPMYDCRGFKNVYIEGGTVTGRLENANDPTREMVYVFSEDDIISARNSQYGGADVKVKYYKNKECTEYDEQYFSQKFDKLYGPDEAKIEIPDMRVAEIDDKWGETKIIFKYEDGKSLEFKAGECDKSLINNGHLLDDIISHSALGVNTLSVRINGSNDYLKASYTISESLAYVTFDDKSALRTEYYEHQTFAVPEGLKLVEHYYTTYASYKAGTVDRTEQKEIPSGLFDGCQKVIDAGAGSKGGVSLASNDAANPDKCDVYEFTVKADTVANIEVELDLFFSGIILGEPIDLTDCYITVTFSHGQTARLAMTDDMIGNYSETTGEQDVEITYRGKSTMTAMTVRKVKSFALEEGLDKYYLLGDSPSPEVWIKVTFTDNDADYIRLPENRVPALDLSKTGNGSVTLTFGGASTTFDYRVIDGAYISYTETDGEITLSKLNLGVPQSGALAWVPDDIKNIVIPETIDGKPVVKLAANLFKDQTILRTLTVPASVKTVGTGLVDGCANLTELTVTGALPLKSYFTAYKKGSLGTSATYPNLPKKLEVVVTGTRLCDDFLADLYFSETEKTLYKLTLGNNVADFGAQKASDLRYVRAFGDGGSASVYADNGVVFADGGSTIVYYCAYKTDKKYDIPAGVTKASMTSPYITELGIPASVATLGEDFMNDANELVKATFAADSAVTVLTSGAFGGCEKLSDFTFPQNLVTVEDFVLSYTAIERLVIPAGVTSVGSGAFNRVACTHLYIPSGAVQSFKNQTSLLSLPNLTTVAYDGSVSIYSLKIMDINAKSLELYITGETADIDSNWYSNGVNQRVSKVYVCSGTNFSVYAGALSYTGQVIKEENGASIDKWWL